jgi:hypothetical protein
MSIAIGSITCSEYAPPDRTPAGSRVLAAEGPNGTSATVLPGYRPPFRALLRLRATSKPAVEALKATVQTLSLGADFSGSVLVEEVSISGLPVVYGGTATTIWTITLVCRESA